MNDYYPSPTVPVRNTLARAEQIMAELAAVSAGFDLLPTVQQIKSLTTAYATTTGTGTAYAATPPYPLASYQLGQGLTLRFHATNTGTATLNLMGQSGVLLGVKPLLRADGTDMQAGDIVAGQIQEVRYDGSAFRVISTILRGEWTGTLPSQSGNAGKSLITDGTAAAWGFPGSLLRVTGYASSGTWIKGAGTRMVRVRGVAGGGSGPGGESGGIDGTGGGGGGGYFEAVVDVSAISSVPYAVGNGGAQQTTNNADGNDGGTTSFGTYASAAGGAGGKSRVNGGSPGAGGTAMGGYLNIPGASGEVENTTFAEAAGRGGNSILGFGITGQPGTGYGSGGAGAVGPTHGKAGAGGRLIVEEFA